jgi:hypothetical protein
MAITDEQNFLPPQHDWNTGDLIRDVAWLKWFNNVGNLHKSIKFVNVVGDLDDIADGTSYGRVNLACLDASSLVLLSQCTGDLDDIADGTYGKVLKTDISAGHTLLSECSGDLDDIADGTYGKVLKTDISSGHILLSECTGDLDDIGDGTSYGKVLATAISAGKINLSAGAPGLTGSLTVGFTDADVTADNGQNLGWLIGSSGTLTLSSTGKMAINAAGALEIQAGGNIKGLGGTDIELTPSDASPSLIEWTDKYYLGAGATEANGLCIYPHTANTGGFRIGALPTDGSTKQFASFDSNCLNVTTLQCYKDANEYAYVQILSNLFNSAVDLYAEEGASSCKLLVDGVTGKAYVTGILSVSDYGAFSGGVHVGGTSDPGTDQLLVDGVSAFNGAPLSPRCGVRIFGPGNDSLSFSLFCEDSGGTNYFSVRDDGRVWCYDRMGIANELAIGGIDTQDDVTLKLQGVNTDNADYVFWAEDSTPNPIMSCTNAGNFWVSNNCSALSFTDRSKFYRGSDPIADLEKIREVPGSENGDWSQIDHDSLPEGLRSSRADVKGRDIGAQLSMITSAVLKMEGRIKSLEQKAQEVRGG